VGRAVDRPGQSGSSKLADRVTVPLRSITEDYFEVMGMTIAEGRALVAVTVCLPALRASRVDLMQSLRQD
jgi:hypothetical protein